MDRPTDEQMMALGHLIRDHTFSYRPPISEDQTDLWRGHCRCGSTFQQATHEDVTLAWCGHLAGTLVREGYGRPVDEIVIIDETIRLHTDVTDPEKLAADIERALRAAGLPS